MMAALASTDAGIPPSAAGDFEESGRLGFNL